MLWGGASPARAAGSGTSGDPYTTLADAYGAASGRHYFDTGSGPFQADVDNSEGGGWVLVLQYGHRFNTNPALSVLGAGADLPVTSASGLGTDESGIPSKWGHAGNAAMSRFPGDIELRWYGITANPHGRVIHFRSGIGDDYPRTGTGSFSGIQNSFTTLSGHSSNLPGTANNFRSDRGDYAMTQFPFFTNGQFHWGIRGENGTGIGANGTRWEVDDVNVDHSTIHRVWVRSVETGTTVINTNDSGTGSLRAAITHANANPGEDAVRFNIPGAGPHTIAPTSALPALTDAEITVDGTTQPGAACGDLWNGVPHTLKIRVARNGSLMVAESSGITIRGLSLTGNGDKATFSAGASNGIVQCSYLGLAPDGSITDGGGKGVLTYGANTLVGGLTGGQGNVISGNGGGILTGEGATATAMRGNFIGTDPTGTVARPNTTRGINNLNFSATWSDITRNLISGNTMLVGAIHLEAGDVITGSSGDVVIALNRIGTNRFGTAPLPNGGDGISFAAGSISGVTIGGASGGNIISGNDGDGIALNGIDDITILGNHIGVGTNGDTVIANGVNGIDAEDVTGLSIGTGAIASRNTVSGNGNFGILVRGTSPTLAILGNHVGTNSAGLLPRGNGNEGIRLNGSALTGARVEDNVIGDARDTGDGTGIGIIVEVGATATLLRNRVGVGADGTASLGNASIGIAALTGAHIVLGDGTPANANIVANNGSHGLTVFGASSRTASAGTVFYNNAGEGISIGAAANDAGDGDDGANDLLNHPVIAQIAADGTTDIAFDLTLDVPSHGAGYRVDFFRNTVFEAHGEGEIHLGHVEVAHTGGTLRYVGTLTANAGVSENDLIAATVTRIVSGTTYDITSEFSATVSAVSVDPLVVTSTADTDTLGTLRYAINHANANAGADAITFDIAGAGPHTIPLVSPLPDITDPGVSIDGTTQSGAACGQLSTGVPHTLKIHLDGQGGSVQILRASATGITFRGLAVGNSQNKGLYGADADGTTIECSYFGVGPDGTTAAPLVQGNGTIAVQLDSSDGVTIRNSLFSGNNSDATDIGLLVSGDAMAFTGNVVGLTANADAILTNGIRGAWFIVTNSTIGGTTAATRNVISGNGGIGLYLAPGTDTVAVLGNHIGTDHTGAVDLGNAGVGIDIRGDNVTVGGTGAGNVIAGNDSDGIYLLGTTGTAILGNHIGLNAAGTAALGNTAVGIDVGVNNVSLGIGDGTTGGRNLIGGNRGGRQIQFTASGISGATIDGNYIGTDHTGNVIIDNGDGSGLEDAIQFAVRTMGTTIANNVIGGHADTGIEIFGGSTGMTIRGNRFDVGADGISDISAPAGAGAGFQAAIYFRSNNADLTIGGTGAGQGNLIANGTGYGIRSAGNVSDIVSITGNTIRNNPLSGIAVQTGAVAITGNSIHSNGGLGIDLDANGTTANDGGDGDAGPNDLLNFPVIDTFEGDGTTSVNFGLTLDVPANANGYRIDFFKNTVSETYGEGEIHLGSVDVAHGGGNMAYASGNFSVNAPVSAGDRISATATRIVSGITYDITSEFGLTFTATSTASPLIVTSTADTDTLGTLRYAINHANANAGADAITFAIAGAGPHTIALAASLPDITDPGVSVDGTTQTGTACGDLWSGAGHTLKIAVDGNGVAHTLRFYGADSAVRGLSVVGGISNGIVAGGTGFTLTCSYVGLLPDGTTDANGNGAYIAGNDATIGGAATGSGNVIGGNTLIGVRAQPTANNVLIEGNFIGTDPTGTTARPNNTGIDGPEGTARTWNAVRRNLISGNSGIGLHLNTNAGITGVSGDMRVVGNHIGVDRAGNSALANGSTGIRFRAGSASGVTIGGTALVDRNIISGNIENGVLLAGVSGITILGNHIGVNTAGDAAIANGQSGLYVIDGTTIAIGDGTAGGRNVIAGNGDDGITLGGTNTGFTIRDNLIGMARDGMTGRGNGDRGIRVAGTLSGAIFDDNTVSSNDGYGISFGPGTSFATLAITNNRIGTDASGLLPRGNGIDGLHFHLDSGTSSGLTIGGAGQGNVIAANTGTGLLIQDVTGAVAQGNFIGIGADGTTSMPNNHGVHVNDTSSDILVGGTNAGEGNIIAHNLGRGIILNGTARAALVGNRIHSNGSLGIDIGFDGVGINDSGDGDSGPNDLLNHPVIDQFLADGGPGVSYDVTLDVPASANGYRVEFFATASPDTTNGEGQTFLGAVDVAGPGAYSGSFTADTAVAVGDSISATATRRTGSGFDITSEFSVNATSRTANPARLAAAKSVEVIEDGLVGGDDTVAIPGATMRYTITIRNDGAGAADAGTTVIADQIPVNGSLKVNDFGGVAGAGPLGVTQGSPVSGLSYSYLGLASGTDDLEFSDDDGVSWTYAPMDSGDGTDPGVTHIRVRPDGAFNANGGTPPSITMQYEVVLF